jgi:hypothetical protein
MYFETFDIKTHHRMDLFKNTHLQLLFFIDLLSLSTLIGLWGRRARAQTRRRRHQPLTITSLQKYNTRWSRRRFRLKVKQQILQSVISHINILTKVIFISTQITWYNKNHRICHLLLSAVRLYKYPC